MRYWPDTSESHTEDAPMTLREQAAYEVFSLIYRTTDDTVTRDLAQLMMRVTDIVASGRSNESKVEILSSILDDIALDWARRDD